MLLLQLNARTLMLLLLLLLLLAIAPPATGQQGGWGCPGDADYDLRAPPPILSWHVHVVWPCQDGGAEEHALRLREQLISHLNIEHDCDALGYSAYNPHEHTQCIIRPYTQPRNPFPTCRFRLSQGGEDGGVSWMGKVTSFLSQHRGLDMDGRVDIYTHPLTGCQYIDHFDWAFWMGFRWPLVGSGFTCNYPGCSRGFAESHDCTNADAAPCIALRQHNATGGL